MFSLKKSIYKTRRIEDIVELIPFDYMIVTYFYDNTPSPSYPVGSPNYSPDPRDLDSRTSFANTGTTEDSKWVGCGQTRYVTPNNSVNINTAYLFQPGDDNGNGEGESILINFKNLKQSGLTLNNDIEVKLQAGWCKVPSTGPVCDVRVRTYIGGTLTITNQVITSNGALQQEFVQTGIPVVINGGCCANNNKTIIGTIKYKISTGEASVNFLV